jgi:hypothetical protein
MSLLGSVDLPVHEGAVPAGLAELSSKRVTMSKATWQAAQASEAMRLRLSLAIDAGAAGTVAGEALRLGVGQRVQDHRAGGAARRELAQATG